MRYSYGPPIQPPIRDDVPPNAIILTTLWGVPLYWDPDTDDVWWGNSDD